ncbi:MAG: NAD(P)-dependent oxidoreductase [Actinomycetota bacterium]
MSPLTPPSTITVLGLGAMGRRVVQRLVDAGYQVRAWNRSTEPGQALAQSGAMVTEDLAGAVRGSALVLSCVRDDDASAAVWDAATPALDELAITVELSTVSPAHSRVLGERFGSRFIEAPMIGSRPQIEAGQLQLLIAGDDTTLATAEPVLSTIAAQIHRTGPVGSAAVVKLIVNGLLTVQMAAMGELLRAAQHHHVSPSVVADLIAALPVASPALARSLPRGLAEDFAPNFPLALVAKDLHYLTSLTPHGAGVMAATLHRVNSAVTKGQGDLDIVALLALESSEP